LKYSHLSQQGSQPPTVPDLPEVTITSTSLPPIFSLGILDYSSAGLGGYSALTDEILSLGGNERTMYGLPSIISHLPAGVAGAAPVIQMTSQLKNGDVTGAIQTGGSGVGGIAGAEAGAEAGVFFAPPSYDAVTSLIFGVAGGLGGSLAGGLTAGTVINAASNVSFTPSTPYPY
jgi:hypothetical protein